ncbi:MAG TPA: hypothetical protein VMW72_01375 [Sedimentisphaerales bacterium]|nr:hypothetical protein [Sedimentisphaerales bacterium]
MSTLIHIASVSPDVIKAIILFCFVAVILAGPLVYRILSGEKFGWFSDPRFRRPNKKQWQQLRKKADQIIEDKLEVEAAELCELINKIQIEINHHKYKNRTEEYENDCERITVLSQKLKDMDLRIEPFDSFAEYLKKDGLIEQAKKIHDMVHGPSNKSFFQYKKEFLDEVVKIKDENWNILSQGTRVAWKQSVKLLKHNPLRSLYVYAALFVFGIGLRFYHSIAEDKSYKFYRKHPIWIIVFVLIIGLPALILAIKFLVWKNSMRENLYQSNLSEK